MKNILTIFLVLFSISIFSLCKNSGVFFCSEFLMMYPIIAANPTKNSFLVKFGFWPNFMLVIGFFLVTGKAGIVLFAALKFDGNDIQFGMPMHAASLVVHRLSIHIDSTDLGYFKRFQYFFL